MKSVPTLHTRPHLRRTESPHPGLWGKPGALALAICAIGLALAAGPAAGQVTLPWIESFESATAASYQGNVIPTHTVAGLTGVTFETDNLGGRLRTNLYARTGARGMTMDDNSVGSSVNSTIITLDMSGYDVSTDTVFLDFSWIHHGDADEPGDGVWVRGDANTDPWVLLYDLMTPPPAAGSWQDVKDQDVTAALVGAGQAFSSSFQIRLGQEGQSSTSAITCCDGQTFDDLYLHEPIELPWTEDFEGTPALTLVPNIANAPFRLDGASGVTFQTSYVGSGNEGRVRTAAFPGSYHNSSARGATLDRVGAGTEPQNQLVVTLDLSNFDAAMETVLLDFAWMHHKDEVDSFDRVKVRGSKTGAWLEIYDWTGAQGGTATLTTPPAGLPFTQVTDLDVSAALLAGSQNFSSTFQISFGQMDGATNISLTDNDGFTVDDIVLHAPAAGTLHTYSATAGGTLSYAASPCPSGPLTRTFVVPESFIVGDVDLGVNLDHTWRGSLDVFLVSPTGTSVEVIDGNVGGTAADNFDVLLDSASGAQVQNPTNDVTAAPYYDRIAGPQNSLNAFNGQQANGVWTLQICDRSGPNDGYFNRAQLRLTETLLASIGDRVWEDRDGDGIQDATEPGLEGIVVELRDGVCTPSGNCPTDTTDATGNYLFENVDPGNYTIVVTNPPSDSSQTHDATAPTTDHSATLTAVGGSDHLDRDFGYRWAGSIGDYIWNDQNGDGVQDGGEPALSGVAVELQYTGCTPSLDCPATTTDGSGAYGFSNLGPRTYTVVVTPPSSMTATYDDDGGNDDQSTVTLPANAAVTDQDFGYAASGAISGTIYFDVDSDTVEITDGLAVGVKVELDDGSCTLGADCDYRLTDAAGEYAFLYLPNGSYTVVVNQPAGSTQTMDPDEPKPFGVLCTVCDDQSPRTISSRRA